MHPKRRIRCEIGSSTRFFVDPLKFVTIKAALSQQFRTGCPWENLYADDLIIISESMEELSKKLILWTSRQGTWALPKQNQGPDIRVGNWRASVWPSVVGGISNFAVVAPVGSTEMQWYFWNSEAASIRFGVNDVLDWPDQWQRSHSVGGEAWCSATHLLPWWLLILRWLLWTFINSLFHWGTIRSRSTNRDSSWINVDWTAVIVNWAVISEWQRSGKVGNIGSNLWTCSKIAPDLSGLGMGPTCGSRMRRVN